MMRAAMVAVGIEYFAPPRADSDMQPARIRLFLGSNVIGPRGQ
jgi:hypothetical protein